MLIGTELVALALRLCKQQSPIPLIFANILVRTVSIFTGMEHVGQLAQLRWSLERQMVRISVTILVLQQVNICIGMGLVLLLVLHL